MEVDNSLASDLTTILWSGRRNVCDEVMDQGLAEVVVVAMIVEAVVKAVVDFLQTQAELTSTPSLKLCLNKNVNVICSYPYFKCHKKGQRLISAMSSKAKMHKELHRS
jgi:hypothetical protein